MDLNTEILIIAFSPFVVVLLFQLSSYLNQTILSSGMKTIEIEDVAVLTGISENRIRMEELKDDQVKFKVFDEKKKEEIGYVVFDQESSKISENNGIEISSEKLAEFRRMLFARLTRIPVERISISPDGDTFTEINTDSGGNEIIAGSVTFDKDNYANQPIETTGKFKKLF